MPNDVSEKRDKKAEAQTLSFPSAAAAAKNLFGILVEGASIYDVRREGGGVGLKITQIWGQTVH